MKVIRSLLRPILQPRIQNAADLWRYVVTVTSAGLLMALSIDVANQLIFFENWVTALRSWTLTIISVCVTAVPVSLLIGRSQRELLQAKTALERLSRTDFLTGLPNRRALMESVELCATHVVALVIVDIDRFKAINDVHGHRIGDVVIQLIGQRLTSAITMATITGRLGGEEFAVLAPADDMEPMLQALEELRSALASTPLLIEGVALNVTISAGVAMSKPGEPFEHVYSAADQALYEAKRAGRNQIALARDLVSYVSDQRRLNAA